MAIIAEWKSEFKSLYKANAQLVANEILEIGETATPQQILDKGRDSSTELHKCFEWDDTAAAEKYRLHQARGIVGNLVFKRPDNAPEDLPEMRVFHVTERGEGYKPVTFIVQDKNEYEKLLRNAMAELQAFKRKYRNLTELQEILDLIP